MECLKVLVECEGKEIREKQMEREMKSFFKWCIYS